MKVMFGNKPVEIGIQTARSEHTHDEYETKEEALLKLQEAKSYTDDAIEELYGADSVNAPTIREIASDEVATALANFKPGIDEAAVAAIVELHNTDDLAHGNIKNDISLLQENKANIIHEHNDLYYTEEEIDSKFTSINEFIQEVQNGTEIIPKASYAESAMKDADGNTIVDTYETKTESIEKLTEAKSYADEAALKVKNDLLNGAADAYDTLKELGDLIDGNKTALDALELVANSKADMEHTHELSEILGDDAVLPIESGGTGATTAEEALANLGAKRMVEITQAEFEALEEKDENTLYIFSDGVDEINQMEMHIKNNFIHVTAAEKEKWNNVDFSAIEQKITALEDKIGDKLDNVPKFSYGTQDLEAGVTPLAEGELYFVYE